MVTIADIARQAGVSKVTVSRVLNNRPDVSAATRDRILRIAREARYAPDARARALVHKHSRIVGLLMDDLATPFLLDHIRGVERATRRAGYQLILSNSDGSPDRERECLRLFPGAPRRRDHLDALRLREPGVVATFLVRSQRGALAREERARIGADGRSSHHREVRGRFRPCRRG